MVETAVAYVVACAVAADYPLAALGEAMAILQSWWLPYGCLFVLTGFLSMSVYL